MVTFITVSKPSTFLVVPQLLRLFELQKADATKLRTVPAAA